MNNIANLNNTKMLLDKYNLSAKISLGQNFLVDENVIDKIVNSVDRVDSLVIIEVGPGLGALTEKMLPICDKLLAIEIDQNMVKVLNENFENEAKLEIINEDILKVNLDDLVSKLKEEFSHVYLVANLPYYITSEILFSIFELNSDIDEMLIMVQTEFGERLISKHNTKAYRPLTVTAKTFYKSKLIFNISKNVFYPKPNVTSSIVKMVRKNSDIQDRKAYLDFVELCFTQKRKTIYNNLRTEYSEEFVLEILELAKIQSNMRPAQLDIADYIRLFEVFYEKKSICQT